MKTCFKCGETKPLTEFYLHKAMADGHLNKCKACTRRDAAEHRAANIERVRAYDRERGMLPHRVEAREAYQNTEQGKAAMRRAHRKYRVSRPDRARAHDAVNNAVRDGRLIPWPVCAVPDCCGRPEAHHPDYSRPLDVVWLCDHHHRAAHHLQKLLDAASVKKRERRAQ